MKRIVVAITGATGAPLALKTLRYLRDVQVEIHLVVSEWAKSTLQQECGVTYADVAALADVVHDVRNQGASISSGSFHIDGMVVVPCSMKTLASIRCGFAENLISRAADVTLKERRRLVLVVRETPLNTIHLENMLGLSRMGCVIFPPTPAFYNAPASLDDVLMHLATRILDQFQLHHPAARRWGGTTGQPAVPCDPAHRS